MEAVMFIISIFGFLNAGTFMGVFIIGQQQRGIIIRKRRKIASCE
ncbi:hypothetical protein SAMN05421503_0233 [Terribacillus aidingensis]|uniref:Uncharacterized protein n=1 Tax=Terribacillus aidingensis TaxID=586416 RepID=A0A285N1Y0_9BACI|nr:hypothetical protein [Terribacillus aidingensis]SNZ02933.1 hypothetical protein SAMN05421503_0233 [Terribacillus aidingensis]